MRICNLSTGDGYYIIILTYLYIHEKDHDTESFLLALRDVAEARGGLSNLAKKTKLNRQNLYRALSDQGNPRLDTLGIILEDLGLRLSIEQSK